MSLRQVENAILLGVSVWVMMKRKRQAAKAVDEIYLYLAVACW